MGALAATSKALTPAFAGLRRFQKRSFPKPNRELKSLGKLQACHFFCYARKIKNLLFKNSISPWNWRL